jgi:hypothetical protein
MKRTAFAYLFALALVTGTAQAQVVGGGGATISGGGDDMTITYSTGGAGGGYGLQTQAPRLAAVTNGRVGAGSAISVEYMEPETAPSGREAWLVGGGDGAEVVYVRPR